MEPILIYDQVRCTIPGHVYEAAAGVVRASRATGKGIEHEVEFPRRRYTQEEMDRGEDTIPNENIVWLLEGEIEKV